MKRTPRKAKLPPKTLLESASFPYDALASFAVREGRRPRPIYQIHKWFARRLGCSFRALLVGAVEHDAANFWQAYYETANLSGLTVLDPFVGGGTAVVEAARLGATAIGIDVDPIACAVTAAELKAGSFKDLHPALRALQESVGQAIEPYHITRGPCGEQLTVVHHFWVQVVECPDCETEGEAHPNFVLADEAGREKWAFCRNCHEVQALKKWQTRFTCRSCATETNLDRVPVNRGTYTCEHCSCSVPLIALGRAAGQPPNWRLFAIEASSRATGRPIPIKERRFFRATAADQRVFTRATEALKKELAADPHFLPQHSIDSEQRSDTRLTDYGYRKWSQLFNDRQLLHLGHLAREIRQLPDGQRCALGLAFSNHLTTNCMLTSYAAGWRRLTPLFSIRAFRHIPRPVEVNPWSEGTGRGTFPNGVRQVMRASAFAQAPKEPVVSGGFQQVEPVAPQHAPKVIVGNARELTGIESNSVDIVVTDPPYFDNVAYSELSDFFQPWLEGMGLVPDASTRSAMVRRALRARRRSDDSLEEFAVHLGEAFAEIRRVLKPCGLLAFTFRHSTAEAWLAMAKALALSRLKPVQVLPMPGEAGTGLHTREGTSLWDAVLVFRKTRAAKPTEMLSAAQIDAAQESVRQWKGRFHRHAQLRFNDADFVNLFRASLVAASLGLYGTPISPRIPIRLALESAIVP